MGEFLYMVQLLPKNSAALVQRKGGFSQILPEVVNIGGCSSLWPGSRSKRSMGKFPYRVQLLRKITKQSPWRRCRRVKGNSAKSPRKSRIARLLAEFPHLSSFCSGLPEMYQLGRLLILRVAKNGAHLRLVTIDLTTVGVNFS